MDSMMFENIRMLVAITERGAGQELTRWMRARGVGYQMRCHGQGTAPSEVMDLLGLGSSEKDIVVSLGRESAVEQIVREYVDNMRTARRGKGLMMLLSPNAVGRLIAAILSMNPSAEAEREGDTVMQNEHRHSLILIAVNQGYSDPVMQTARRAGATGGTIVRAHLSGSGDSASLFGVPLQTEREIVAILAPDSIREQLMNDVNREHGLRTAAQGVICSLPVDRAFTI